MLRNAVAAGDVMPPSGDASPLGDLFALANAVAAMVGGAVTIEDPRSNVLAYSSLGHLVDEPRRQTILGRRVPDSWTKRLRDEGVMRQMWASSAVVRFEDQTSEARPRLAIAIRAGAEVLGSIWVVEGSEPLGPEAEQALSEAARVAALHVLRHQASDDLDRRERGILLRGLLEGRRAPTDAATVLGIDLDSPCAVVAFRLQLEDDAELSLKRTRAVDLITVYCEGFRRRAACAWIGDTVYVLLPSLDDVTAARVMPLTREIAAHAGEALKVTLRGGVGSIVPTVGDVVRSREEADRVLRVLRDAPGRVAHIDDVRVGTILLELGDILRSRPDLRVPALDALAAHDAERSKSYLETLTAYLDAFGDVSVAARTINLHPNSFRYRLRRLRELTGIDLSDPDDRLVIALQLRLGGK
jgi:DNA-binding PucR family transcriptional regulator